jgi:class 3 adenylate cyclase
MASGEVPGAVERRVAAILHADVAGYSRSMAGDEGATVSAVRAMRGVVEGVVRQHRGRLVDFTGDECPAEFASAVDAVSALEQIIPPQPGTLPRLVAALRKAGAPE